MGRAVSGPFGMSQAKHLLDRAGRERGFASAALRDDTYPSWTLNCEPGAPPPYRVWIDLASAGDLRVREPVSGQQHRPGLEDDAVRSTR